MSMPTLKRQWTVADLSDLPDDSNRYEVIDGELFVTPSPSWPHQTAVMELYTLLAAHVTAYELGDAFVAPADVVFSARRGVQPDLFVVPPFGGKRPTAFDQVKRLMLAVEIISPSTARADRVKKRFLYRDEGVPEYWIVDLDARAIERSTPTESRPEVIDERFIWAPEAGTNPLESTWVPTSRACSTDSVHISGSREGGGVRALTRSNRQMCNMVMMGAERRQRSFAHARLLTRRREI